uniref:Protein ACCELERATED CELL DEATH 6 isoform X2 n=1 Tax=Elaeis guineensis var. tenera TaxID=51953 RepID=A0A8N4F5Q8_ELAGV|nr:protein ACCELERATED CELL DEATH 6 isoform X2 [Elaeis guineensis]
MLLELLDGGKVRGCCSPSTNSRGEQHPPQRCHGGGGDTVLHIAAKMGHAELAKAIRRLEPLLLTRQNSKGDTPVHCAARAGHHAIVTSFVSTRIVDEQVGEEHGRLLRVRNGVGNTALHEAAQNGHLEVVQAIMSVDPDSAAVVNQAGVSPLYMAAERGSSNIVRSLQWSEACSYEGPNGQTALHAAVLICYDITELILEQVPVFIKRGDATNNSTPLHYVLLDSDNSASYLRDKDGFAPIHVAASAGHLNIIAELLQHCPDCMELINNQGRNFLHVAIMNKRLEIVKYVLESAVFIDLLNEPDNEGNTPLHLAVISRSRQITQILSSDGRVNTSIMNNKGHTPLDLASLASNWNWEIALRMYKIVIELINHGSRLSPQRLDLITCCLQKNQEAEINQYRAFANNLIIVAVLIATVTFAAAFTLPGGYKGDSSSNAGSAILANRAAFKAFLVSDSLAMISSISVAIILLRTGSLDHDIRLYSLITAMKLLWVALGGMFVAFATGVYVAVVSNCKWLAILVAVMICSIPLGAWMTAYWPNSDFLSLVKMNIIQENDTPITDLDYRWYNKQVAIRRRLAGIADFHTP